MLQYYASIFKCTCTIVSYFFYLYITNIGFSTLFVNNKHVPIGCKFSSQVENIFLLFLQCIQREQIF